MSDTPTLKNVSTADLERSLANTLAGLSGWEDAQVHVQQIQYDPTGLVTGERITLQLSVSLRNKASDDVPF